MGILIVVFSDYYRTIYVVEKDKHLVKYVMVYRGNKKFERVNDIWVKRWKKVSQKKRVLK